MDSQSRLLARPSTVETIVRRFQVAGGLSAAEIDLLTRQWSAREHRNKNEKLVQERHPIGLRLVASGWAALVRSLPDGRRQIFSVILAGDLLSLCAYRKVAPYSIISLTDVEIMNLDPLAAAVEVGDAPACAAALTQIGIEAEDRMLEAIVRLGRLTALERLAHFILETHDRLLRIGLAQDYRFALPLNQEQMGDLLGLSVVHVNRTMQALRRMRLIEVNSGVVAILEPERLAALCFARNGKPAPKAAPPTS